MSMIKIESIKYKLISKNPYKLTVVDERDTLFQDITAKIDSIEISIEPEQHLLIPIEFGFETRIYKKEFKTGSTEIDRAALAKKLSGQKLYMAKLPTEDWNELTENPRYIIENIRPNELAIKITQTVAFSNDFLGKTKPIEELLKSVPNRFAIGSLMNIVSVRINGKDIPSDNPLNEPRFFMSGFFGYGSCPYLLVYNSQKGYWIEQGTVLTNRQAKSLQDYEVHNLGSDTTKIKLEERDKEISYIDSLSILYADPTTQTTREAIPPIPKLAKADEEYMVLHQGESVEIDLRKLIPANASDVKLKINGYYQILETEGERGKALMLGS